MRGKAKQRVSLILVVTMVLGTALTGNTVFATGESSDEQDRIKINISKDSEQTVEQNVAQTIHVTAQGQCSQSVCLNVYLKNEDGSAATDIDAVNLLKSYNAGRSEEFRQRYSRSTTHSSQQQGI